MLRGCFIWEVNDCIVYININENEEKLWKEGNEKQKLIRYLCHFFFNCLCLLKMLSGRKLNYIIKLMALRV